MTCPHCKIELVPEPPFGELICPKCKFCQAIDRLPDLDRTWVRHLPNQGIEEILYTLHDCQGSYLRKALLDEKWRRHAVPISAWPTYIYDGPWEPFPDVTFVEACAVDGNVVAPDDPQHRPAAKMTYGRLGTGLLCSCGNRGDLSRFRLYRTSTVWAWPRNEDGTLVVCHRAKSPSDPFHGAIHAESQTCICGAYLDAD